MNAHATHVGAQLRHWRQLRRLSQAHLAEEAQVSARHLSCLETGKARPSREMMLVLCSALEVPLGERNVLLKAAGFSPAYPASGLDAPEMASVRQAVDLLLERHMPYPASVVDAQWNILLENEAGARLADALLPPDKPLPGNVLHRLFDPGCLRPHVENFEALARLLVQRLRREALVDPRTATLLDELLAHPDLPPDLDRPLLETADLLVPVVIRLGDVRLRLFSTLTTLGTAMDVTLQSLRIESYFPADEATRTFFETSG